MKKLILLSVCFILFVAFKSKAQTTTYSTFPDQTLYGYCSVSAPNPYNNQENDVIYPEPPSGFWCEGTSLTITAYGDLGDEIDIENDFSYGAINFLWDRSVLDSYPGESFTLVYGWECDYTDGVNHYICGGGFN